MKIVIRPYRAPGLPGWLTYLVNRARERIAT